MIPELPNNTPVWVISFVIVFIAISSYGKNVITFIKQLFTTSIVASLQKQIEELKIENHEVNEELKRVYVELNTMEKKYAHLEGVILGFQIYLKDKGFKDFPTILKSN